LDTVHFKHKNITNPTITHANKVMQALAECIKTMTGATGGTTALEAKDLQRIVKATRAALHNNDAPINNSNAEHQAPRMPKLPRVHALPRVPPTTADNQRITRAMSEAQNGKQSSVSGNRVPFPDSDSQNGKQSSVSGNRVPFPETEFRFLPGGQTQTHKMGNRVPFPEAEFRFLTQTHKMGNRVPFPETEFRFLP
jgi:hypothetical protein